MVEVIDMKNKKLATFLISMVMVTAVVLTIGLTTAIHPAEDQNVSFNVPVDVEEGTIVYEEQSVRFEPLGEDAVVIIDSNGPDGLSTEVHIYPGNGEDGDIVSGTVQVGEPFTAEVEGLDGRDMNIVFEPVSDGSLSPASYEVGYELTVSSSEKVFSGAPLVMTIVLLAFAVFMLLTVNMNDGKFDERQLAARGEAAMNSFMVSVLCCVAIGLISKGVSSFPLSVYETTMVVAIVAVTTFAILSDINDAYIGIKERRRKMLILTWVMAFASFIGACMIAVGMGFSYDMARTALIVGVCLVLLAIELTVKTIIEKRGDRDEES